MGHRFTFRESFLLVICALIGLGIFYYQFAYKHFQSEMASYDVSNIESEVMVYQARLTKKKSMQEYIDANKGRKLGEIVLYNNLANEISEIGRIFDGVDDLSVSWSDPTLLDTIVRRNANISFSTTGYTNVVDLIEKLNNSTYRCLISDVSVTADKNEILNENAYIKANIRITFFERVDETTNLDGLTILNS
ncbi:MAG: hypothetical protein IJI66_00060 [Erysipelotrichaceae bacterium]|nr:hypothetical protein [Erysipelotrichaceae bacterium]